MESVLAALSLVVLGWAVVSIPLARWNITGPLVFTVAGFLLGNQVWGPVPVDVDAPPVHVLAELTLALLLFSDASRVNITTLRRDMALPGRLLGISLPLSVILGSLAAAVLFTDFTWALAIFVGAALAPTDAGLSAQVIDDERVPSRVRRALNIESGLNDGIVTPIVMFSLAIAANQGGSFSDYAGGPGAAVELAVGVSAGVVLARTGLRPSIAAIRAVCSDRELMWGASLHGLKAQPADPANASIVGSPSTRTSLPRRTSSAARPMAGGTVPPPSITANRNRAPPRPGCSSINGPRSPDQGVPR
ncbi:cation:proton antiporter [Microbacterium sp. DT81.1]|uniref:cation:proton antiporter domain-containing protein n=1 Tax=Microbacterium sp. DT81.1 TaxID=3393413 RepID=UPI003CF4124E